MNSIAIEFSKKIEEFGLISKAFIKLVKIQVKDSGNDFPLWRASGHLLDIISFNKPIYFNESFNRCITSCIKDVYMENDKIYIESADSVYRVEFLPEEKQKNFYEN